MKNAACEFRFFVTGEGRSEFKTVSIVERKGANSDAEGLEMIAEALRRCGGFDRALSRNGNFVQT